MCKLENDHLNDFKKIRNIRKPISVSKKINISRSKNLNMLRAYHNMLSLHSNNIKIYKERIEFLNSLSFDDRVYSILSKPKRHIKIT